MSEIRFKDACGEAGKVLAVRLLPGTDLIEGIEAACKKNGIKYAYVSCLGSFRHVGYKYMVPMENAKVGSGYGEVFEKNSPIEFLNGTGVVCQNHGNYDTHFHATMCDEKGTVFGGHIVKGMTPALTTVDTTIIEIKGVKMLRDYDEETDLTQFIPENE
jgi:predicted DNA-binding protein with PD1-like motif